MKQSIAALESKGIARKPGAMETKEAPSESAETKEIKDALADLQKTNKDHRDAVDEQIAELKKTGNSSPETEAKLEKLNTELSDLTKKLDAVRLDSKRPQMSSDGKRELSEAEVKHAKAARDYITKGDDSGYDEAELKSLSAGSDPDGGYAVNPEMDAAISRVLSEASPIRSVANVVSIGSGSFKRLVNVGGVGSGWVGETESRPQTDAARLRERTYPAMELYAMPAATQTLLDDASFDVESWLADEVQIEFAEAEGSAFVMGDGAGKPRGFIGGYTPVADSGFSEKGGAPGFIKTGASGGFKTTNAGDPENNLIDLIMALKAGYRAGARFVMNRKTIAAVRKLRDADGRSFWQPSTQAGVPSTLLGYPVLEAEDMPDMAANAFPIAFGDFNRGYQIVDRFGTRILRDPYSAKPFIQFYTTKRVGGGIRMAEAIKLLKFSA